MVGVTIDCRLGNQLFQYAFVNVLAKRFDSSFYTNEKCENEYPDIIIQDGWLKVTTEDNFAIPDEISIN